MSLIAQAGAIAVDLRAEPPRFLLVTARRAPECWIFPKGTIEPGESPAEAAVRELEEEAGVNGAILGKIGNLAFRRGLDQLSVVYYLVRADSAGEPREGRRLRWLEHEDARTQLSFVSARALLDQAVTALGD